MGKLRGRESLGGKPCGDRGRDWGNKSLPGTPRIACNHQELEEAEKILF